MATQVEPIKMTRQGRVAVTDLVVQTEADNERALATIKELSGRRRTRKEDALFEILSDEIERFESKAYPSFSTEASPAEIVQLLLEMNGQSPKGLWGVVGQKSHVSEILAGARSISNRTAGLLGKHFNVPPELFVRFG